MLMSGESFSDDKSKAEILQEGFSLFCYFACCKINTSNMSKSTYFGLMVKCTPERGHNALFFIPLEVIIML